MTKGPTTEKRAGPGRPRTYAERINGVPVRLLPDQRTKLKHLGGSSWARAAIEAEWSARQNGGPQPCILSARPELPTRALVPGVDAKRIPCTVQLTPTHVERLGWLGGPLWLGYAIDDAYDYFMASPQGSWATAE